MSTMRRAMRVATIEKLRHQLNLLNWDVRLSGEAPSGGDERQAEVNRRDDERIAEIRLHPDLPEEMDELCLAHEMIHLVLYRHEELATRLLTFVKDDQARTMFAEMLEDTSEQAIDQMAYALSKGPRFVAFGPLVQDFPTFARKRLVN